MITEAEFHYKTYNYDGTLASVKIYPIVDFSIDQSISKFDPKPIFVMGKSEPVYFPKPRTNEIHVTIMYNPLEVDPNNYHDYRGCPRVPEASIGGQNMFIKKASNDLAKRASHINIEE